MVSTRRKSYAPGTQGEGTEPNGTTPGLSARRSFNSESEVSSMAQQSTPARRSRRLSNSSAGNSDDNTSETVPLSAKRRKRGELSANSVNTDNSAEAKDEPKLQPIDEREESAQSAAESEIIPDESPKNENSQDKTGDETTKSESASPDTKTDAVSQKANNNQTAENKKSANQENNTANGNVVTSGTTQKLAIPRGRPKSGRVWKEPKTNPRTMYKDRGMKMPLEKVLQLKQERQRVKDIQNRMKEEKQRAKEDLRRRQEINKKKREENEKKGEVVQVIRNSNKLKRMKKKQLKLIQKRDTTSM